MGGTDRHGLTDTDLRIVVEHVKRMLPAMLIETAPDYSDTQKLIARIEENLVRVEEHLARSEERSAQEFKALRELMHAGFAAVDKRFEDMNKRFEDMNKRFTALQWMGTVAFVVLGIVISVVGLS